MSRDLAASEDLSVQVVWRGMQAKILARQGRGEDAEVLAREAVQLAADTDLLTYHGDALVDLAEVLHADGRAAEAADSISAGLRLYERKGNLAAAERARAQLVEPGGM